MRHPEYEKNVFINCPFDQLYTPIFEAVVFSIHDAGFRPKCARERLDSSQIRLHKIVELIAASRYAIHDLSRTTFDDSNGLPRFNMPLELGIDLGCKAFSQNHNDKSLLIFDAERSRFQKYVSDLGGQDIQHHANDPKTAVTSVRNWLRAESDMANLPSGAIIFSRYEAFRDELPALCSSMRLDEGALTFADFSHIVARWLHPEL